MRCSEMRRREQRARSGAVFQELAPRYARGLLIKAREAVPVRLIDLDRMMDHVAAEECYVAVRIEIDDEVPGCVAGCGCDRDVLLDRLRAFDNLTQHSIVNRQHADA